MQAGGRRAVDSRGAGNDPWTGVHGLLGAQFGRGSQVWKLDTGNWTLLMAPTGFEPVSPA